MDHVCHTETFLKMKEKKKKKEKKYVSERECFFHGFSMI